MYLTSEGAAILLLLLVLYVAIVIGVGVVGLILIGRGWRVIGAVLLLATLGWTFYPNIQSRIALNAVSAEIAATTRWPETLPLAGRDVIFIGTGGSFCDGICTEALQIGGLGRIYHIGLNGFTWPRNDDDDLIDMIRTGGYLEEVELGAPTGTAEGARFPEAAPVEGFPEVDYVVIADEAGASFAYYMGEQLGTPWRTDFPYQQAFYVFEGWPEPGQAPIVAMINAYVPIEPILIWPFHTNGETVPSYGVFEDVWRSWFCVAAQTGQGGPGTPYGEALCAAATELG